MAHLPPTFEARLARARALTPSVRELVFERVDGQPMDFVPGQWVSAILGVEAPLAEAKPGLESPMKRSYSIASSPDGSPRFEIAVTHVQNGPGSTRLHTLEPGAVLRFTGPQGFFTRPAQAGAPPSLMIATGTGVTPMRSMLRAAAAQGSRAPFWLVLGVRHEDDLLYVDEFRAAAREHSFFRFEPTLSQPGPGWEGRRGYVQTHVHELWTELAARGDGAPHAYVCGLERMVGSVRDLLRKEMGLPRQQVHSERYD
jgi:ferredoxin-NADP reductase